VDDFTRQFGTFGGNVSLFLRLVLFSSFAAVLSAQSIENLVSVEELRNPLTGRPLRALVTARNHLKSGQRELGMQELHDALSDPVAMPYAISMVGAEHLRAGLLDTAIYELEQAIRLLPGRPENHANLAYAYCLKGQPARGLEEIRKALQLDGGMSKTRLVMGMLLLEQGSHDAEAIQQLQAAAQEEPDAHLILAAHYELAGKALEAEKERRAYSVKSMAILARK
jgi:tetratricopeptide (TPR) repeat protein